MSARRTITAGLCAAFLWIAAPAAQVPQAPPQDVPPKGIVPKGRAPVSNEVLKLSLPKPAEADLANGAHLMVLEDRRAPQVSIQIYIPGAGGYFDPAGMAGLATMTAAQMREGAGSWDTTALNEELERLAATVAVSASASGTEAVLTASALTEHLDRVMDIAAAVLLNPTFPDEEFARYKQRTRATLMQQRSFPGFLLAEAANRVIYGDHPGSRVAISLEALDKATREDLAAFHKARYVPDHAAIAVAGDISMAEARALIESKLAGWTRANSAVPETADPEAPAAAAVHFVARPNAVQTNLAVTAPGIRRTDQAYDVLSVMNKVLGGGPTGRLFIHLREEKGYTYGAYSRVDAGMYRGDWIAQTDVRTDVTEPALADLMAEITRMRDEPVPAGDLDAAKRSMIAAFALSLESPQSIMNYHVTSWRYKLPADYWDRQPQRIMAVTAGQVQAAAKTFLDPAKLQIVAVGDAAKIAEILAKHGTVVTYDTEGRVIK